MPDAQPIREPEEPRSRIRRIFFLSRGLIRVVYRDPEHVSERMTLFATERLAEESRAWAANARERQPDLSKVRIADELRIQSARVARIDGAIAGTPFFIALIPGYLTYLLQEMRMTLRTAALYGRDPGSLQTAAEMLALRQVHPSVEAALEALRSVKEHGLPDKPPQRRALRLWVRSGYVLLVFGGFLSPSAAGDERGWREWLKTGFGLLTAVVLWVVTWVFPLTFMVAMAWGCESHTRSLGQRTIEFYDENAVDVELAIARASRRHDRGHDKRTLLRAGLLFLSISLPIVFIAYVDHIRNTVGVNGLGAAGALVALSLVIATLVVSNKK